MRVHIPRGARLTRILFRPAGKVILGLTALCLIAGIGAFSYYWVKFSKIIDVKLKEGPFSETAVLYAAPDPVSVGDKLSPDELVALLKRRGYTENRSNRMGWYHMRSDAVEVFPGVDAYQRMEPGVIFLDSDTVTRIVSSRDNTDRSIYYLEPEILTNLFDRNRQKRRPVKFEDIPKVLVNAILSAEDKRFFQHAGFDPIRLAMTAWVDITQNRRHGASTITMQLARTFFLNRDRTPKRKAAEAMITLQLEKRMTKEEIFENYVNFIDLGWRRSFAVQGFGEAAQVNFGKDIRELSLVEAATLAGMVQGPNLYNPFRNPERTMQRRNIILMLMKENGYITDAEYQAAIKEPIRLQQGGVESADAPYFVDLVNDTLQDQFGDIDFQSKSYRVYTTLDMKLQRDAIAAIQQGMKEVDELLAKRKRKYPQPQVALVALDPATGEVKALVGGRSYGQSQLNRTLSKRQPGSIFKPFVYASALNTTLEGTVSSPLTPVTMVTDEPTTFWYDDKPYEPNNFREEFHGSVTMRQALSKSMNIPTVKFAELAGYDHVAALAKTAGLNGVRATPSLALGSYEVTPLEMAGAYTVFSNGGQYVKQSYIKDIRTETGAELWEEKPVRKQALDPRVAYMVVELMQEVLRSGTGAGARARGFGLPAAGKTGTSHDAWFAGFTSKLLCVVWVGFDNNDELPLEGSKAALPIWTEFMKRAHGYREYRGVTQFRAPDGITTVDIDPLTGQLASASCPKVRAEVFIAGTQPVEICHLHGGGRTMIAGWESAEEASPAPAPVRVGDGRPPASAPPAASSGERRAQAAKEQPRIVEPVKKTEKKSVWQRLRGIFN